jgi:ADP-heptose:LPS heptosyltransferase
LTKKISLEAYEGKHVLDYYLELLENINFRIHHRHLEIFTSAEDETWVSHALLARGIQSTDCVVGIVPGGGASWGKDAVYKRWPAEKFALLCDKIIEKFSAKIILMGDQNESELCQYIKSSVTREVFDFSGTLTIGKLAAVLKRCKLAVVNDGGPLHIAVACGIKTISIFGPVDERTYGPYPSMGHFVVSRDLACRPCYRRFRLAECEHHQCLNISLRDVFEKVEKIL